MISLVQSLATPFVSIYTHYFPWYRHHIPLYLVISVHHCPSIFTWFPNDLLHVSPMFPPMALLSTPMARQVLASDEALQKALETESKGDLAERAQACGDFSWNFMGRTWGISGKWLKWWYFIGFHVWFVGELDFSAEIYGKSMWFNQPSVGFKGTDLSGSLTLYMQIYPYMTELFLWMQAMHMHIYIYVILLYGSTYMDYIV